MTCGKTVFQTQLFPSNNVPIDAHQSHKGPKRICVSHICWSQWRE